MIDRTLSLLVALSLALLVWLYARSRDQETLDNVAVPVEVSLPPGQADNYHVELTGPGQVLASFTGPPLRIRELQGVLQRKELRVEITLTVPEERLHESRYSDTLHIESDDVPVPPGVSVLLVEGRNRIPVTLHRVVERRLPVRLDHAGDEPVGPVVLEPATVLVRGPREVLDRARFLPTQPMELPARSLNAPPGAALVTRVALVQDLEGRPVHVVPNHVTVRLPAQARRVYELPDVPVNFLCPTNFLLRPKFIDERTGHISLTLEGPIQAEPPRVLAFVDLSRGRFVSGLQHEPLQLQLPPEFRLTREAPRVVAFELLPADFVPGGPGHGVGPP